MSPEDLTEVLRKHELWLSDDPDGERANLQYANLQYANLQYANLRYANLRSADLQSANLQSANLRSADLRSADLRSANLRYAIGEGERILSMQLPSYPVVMFESDIRIGCKKYTVNEWESFSDQEISEMDEDALVWWKSWKDVVLKSHEIYIKDLK